MNTKPFLITGILVTIIIGFFVFGIVSAKNTEHPLFSFSENFERSTQKNIILQPLQQDQNLTDTNSEKIQITDSDVTSVQNSVTTKHLITPKTVRAVYMSAWTASSKVDRDKLLDFISNSTINAVVLDIKDATGRVSFLTNDPIVKQTGSPENKISDIDQFIQELHQKNIYVIGRISVFQDPYLTAKYPEWAIQSNTTKKPWKDHKGLSFLDPTNKKVWDYINALAQESYKRGFDEINFDYIRFPSDGNMKDIVYPESSGTRADMIESFFVYIHSKMSMAGIPTSADLFGLTTEAVDDMGIGQVLEKALPNFDFISPMIYPSHYGKGYAGFTNPADHPYQVIIQAMKEGVRRARIIGFGPEKFRPWIQDFDMGAKYDKIKILDQIKALQEHGITSFMVWDPANHYTRDAYQQ